MSRMGEHAMKLTVMVLTIIVLSQWVALSSRPSQAACPVVDADERASPSYSTSPGSEENEVAALATIPEQPSSLAPQYSAFPDASSSLQGTAQTSRNARPPATPLEQSSRSVQASPAKLRDTAADDLVVLAILVGSLLLLYLVTSKLSRRVAAPAIEPAAKELVEPKDQLRPGQWIVEVNLDDANRLRVFKAIRSMDLCVIRRGKYSLALGNYADKVGASRIVQKLQQKYGVQGWLTYAPEKSARPDRYHL